MRRSFIAVAAVVPAGALIWLACGDSGVDPLRRVVQVVASRNSVVLDVADSVLLRAEARDGAGERISEAPIRWSATPASVVNVSSGGTARAVGPGQGLIVAEAGNHADTIEALVSPPILATTLSTHQDTLTALGDELTVTVTSVSSVGPRNGTYDVATSNYSVVWAAFDPDRPVITVRAGGPGSVYVRVTERHGTRDSVLIVVRQDAARVTLPVDELKGYVARSSQLRATVADRRGNEITGVPVAWRTLDTAVATVTPAGGLLSYRSAGTTRLIAEYGSAIPDTAVVDVEDLPAVVLSVDSIPLGTAMGSEVFWVSRSDYYAAPLGNFVRLTVGDPGVATAPDSVLWVESTGSFTVTAHSPGSTILVASAPGFNPDTAWVAVSTSGVKFLSSDIQPVTIQSMPVGTGVGFGVQLTDSAGVRRRLLQTVTATLSSSDTTVLKWPIPQVTLYAGAESTPVPYAEARAAGNATVYASAPGFRTDSLRLRVTSLPKLKLTGWHTIGLRQKTYDRPWRLTTNAAWSHPDAAVTFTGSNPAIATFPANLLLPSAYGYLDFPVEGLALGVDTIIATAPNFEPDTAVLVVTTPRFLMPDSVDADAFATAVGDSLGAKHLPLDTITLFLTSSDTTRARLPHGVRFPNNLYGTTTIFTTMRDSGHVTIHVADSAGIIPPDSIRLHLRFRTDLSVVENPGYGPLVIGTRQRFEEVRLVALTPGPGVVHLASTDPAVLKVPDSLDIAFVRGVDIPTAGGAVPGTARILASRPGFVPASSAQIEVGVPQFDLRTPDTAYAGGTGYVTSLIPRDQRGTIRQADDTVVATLHTLDPGVTLGSSTLVVPAGAAVSQSVGVTFTTPGTVRLIAADERPVATPYRPDTTIIHVVAPPLTLAAYPYGRTVGVGQLLPARVGRPLNVATNPLTVTVARQGTNSTSAPDVTFSAGETVRDYAVVGRSVGTDTLVLSAPGYDADTARIYVTEGHVTLRIGLGSGPPGQVRVGDSVAVYLTTEDSTGLGRMVLDDTPFGLSASGLSFSDGARTVSEIAVPASAAISPRFFLKGRSAGSTTVTVWNLNYAPLTIVVNVIPSASATSSSSR